MILKCQVTLSIFFQEMSIQVPLPIFKLGYLFLFVLLLRCESLKRFLLLTLYIYKYVLLFHRLPFQSVEGFLLLCKSFLV